MESYRSLGVHTSNLVTLIEYNSAHTALNSNSALVLSSSKLITSLEEERIKWID
jgi:hypothetical protein